MAEIINNVKSQTGIVDVMNTGSLEDILSLGDVLEIEMAPKTGEYKYKLKLDAESIGGIRIVEKE